jgi:hypothetical protein
MSIIYGGVEYKSGDISDYLYDQKTIRLKHTPAGEMMYLYNDEYHVLAGITDDVDFCSCLLYENMIHSVAENVSPSLEFVVEHAKYREDEWFGRFVRLEQQMAEWPLYRERHIKKNGELGYWDLIGADKPVLKRIKFPMFLGRPVAERSADDYKKWMETLHSAELEILPAVKNFEMKLYDIIGRLDK